MLVAFSFKFINTKTHPYTQTFISVLSGWDQLKSHDWPLAGVDGDSFSSRLAVVGLDHMVIIDSEPLKSVQQLPLIKFPTDWDLKEQKILLQLWFTWALLMFDTGSLCLYCLLVQLWWSILLARFSQAFVEHTNIIDNSWNNGETRCVRSQSAQYLHYSIYM